MYSFHQGFTNSVKKNQAKKNQEIKEALELVNSDLTVFESLFKDYQDLIYWKNFFNETILHCAIKRGNFPLANLYCKYILKHEHVLNFQQKQGFTPLHYLSNKPLYFFEDERERIGLCKYLLDQGAKFIKNSHGETPLHLAAKMDHYELVEVFLQYDIEIDSKDNFNETPLLKALKINAFEIVDLLLKKKASLDVIAKQVRQWIKGINADALDLIPHEIKIRFLPEFQNRIKDLLLVGDMEYCQSLLENFRITNKHFFKDGFNYAEILIRQIHYLPNKEQIKNQRQFFNCLLENKFYWEDKNKEDEILKLLIYHENIFLFEIFKKYNPFNEKFKFVINLIIEMFLKKIDPYFFGILVKYVKESDYPVEEYLYENNPNFLKIYIKESNWRVLFNAFQANLQMPEKELNEILETWEVKNILYISEVFYNYSKTYQLNLNYEKLSNLIHKALVDYPNHLLIQYLIALWMTQGGDPTTILKEVSYQFDLIGLIMDAALHPYTKATYQQAIVWIKSLIPSHNKISEKYLEALCEKGDYPFAVLFQKNFFPYLKITKKIQRKKMLLEIMRGHQYDIKKIIKIQLFWRQRHRERSIHTSSILFGPKYTSKNFLIQNDHQSIFQKLSKLIKVGIDAWFSKGIPYQITKHYCREENMIGILSNGTFYSYKVLEKKGIKFFSSQNDNDEARGDGYLICTAPNKIWESNEEENFGGYISINLSKLPYDYKKYLYIKFRDWFFLRKNSQWIDLTDTIKIRQLVSHPKKINYEFLEIFKNSNERRTIQVSVSGESEIFYGQHQIWNIMLHLFYIIEAIPNESECLKNKIYQYFESLKETLPNHLDNIFKSLTEYIEIDFSVSLRLSFDYIHEIHFYETDETVDIPSCITAIQDGKVEFIINILLEHEMLRNSLFFIKEIFRFITKTPHFYKFYNLLLDIKIESKEVNEFIESKEFVVMNALEEYKYLLHPANYAYKNHFSKSFVDTQLYKVDEKIILNDTVIYRPNHGLPNSLAPTIYLEDVITFFERFAINDNFRQFCRDINKQEIINMQIAILFLSSGRKSELGFSDNKEKYLEYRKQSSLDFWNYANQNNMDSASIKKYTELVLRMFDPEYLESIKNASDDKEYIFHLMSFTRDLYLMRCYRSAEYINTIQNNLSGLVHSTETMTLALNNLFQLVSDLIDATGDRKYCDFKDGNIIDVNQDYDPKLFSITSTNPEVCLKICLEALFKSTYIDTLEEDSTMQFSVSSSY